MKKTAVFDGISLNVDISILEQITNTIFAAQHAKNLHI